MENEELKREVKGIWIPIEVWERKDLSVNEKVLFAEVDSYTTKDKDCFMSDEYISKFLGINKTNANKTLSSLIKKGLVIKTRFDGRKRYIKAALSQTTTLTCQQQEGSYIYNNDSSISNDKNISLPIQSTNKESNTDVLQKKNDYQAIFECWNKYNGKRIGKVTQFTEKRKRAIKAQLEAHGISADKLMQFFSTLPFADKWLYNPSQNHKTWKPTFDWWMSNSNNWLTKGLEGGVHLENPQVFNNIMNDESSLGEQQYTPQGHNVYYDELRGFYYYTGFYMRSNDIMDGYTDEERPDGAKLCLNNARGVIQWNANKKEWIKL